MVVDWALTAVFAALVLPCVVRLVRLDYARLGHGVRHGDLAELLLVVAMVAMFSPVGGPIPAAGWQAVLALTTGWFAVAWWRRRGCAHHALSAAAMLYMVTAMPHGGTAHGPWLTMSTMDARLALPLVAVAAAGYFVIDAARAGVRVVRGTAVIGGGAGVAGAGGAATAAAGPVAGDAAAGAGPVAGAGAAVGGWRAGSAEAAAGGGAGAALGAEAAAAGGVAGLTAGAGAAVGAGPVVGDAAAGAGPVAGAGAAVGGWAAGSAEAAAGGVPGLTPGAGAAGPAATRAGAVAGQASRAVCRAVMGAGMGYMLLAAAL